MRECSRGAEIVDFAESNGVLVMVYASRACKHLGPKRFYRDGSPKMAKESGCCPDAPPDQKLIRFTPTYECSIFGKCAPFAAKIEDEQDRTQPCVGCNKFERINLESASPESAQ